MAKRLRKSNQPALGAGHLPGLSPDMVEIEVIESKETWSEYKLKDGTTVRLRPILAGAFRSTTQYNPDGEPVYGVRTGVLPDIRVAPALRRKRAAKK